MIPKILHAIWVGDESKCPKDNIHTWSENHPDWKMRLWNNDDLLKFSWRCKPQIEKFIKIGAWEGVADIMRYEILNHYGGFYFDADSRSCRRLDDGFLYNQMFAVWESERHKPGLIANGFIGSIPSHPILEQMIEHISNLSDPTTRFCFWQMKRKPIGCYKTVGPCLLSKVAHHYPEMITVFPSVLFLPQHYMDTVPQIGGPIFAQHIWKNARY